MLISQLANSDYSGESGFTFVFENEGHTLGNSLQCIISSYPDVEFAGYSVPHPAENRMLFRIQMKHNKKAIDGLQRGLEDLKKLCEHTLSTFNDAVERKRSQDKSTNGCERQDSN